MGIEFVKTVGIPDFEIVSGKSVVNVFPVHVHEKYCIGIVRKGNAVFTHETTETNLLRGCVYFVSRYFLESGSRTGSMRFQQPLMESREIWEEIESFCT